MSTSKLLEDIKSLEDKPLGQKFHTINQITQKSLNNEYDAIEIHNFIADTLSRPLSRAFLPPNDDYCRKLLVINLISNYTRSFSDAIKLLKSEDDQLVIGTIEKCKFLMSDENFNMDFCIESIFPFVSYSNRLKIIDALGAHAQLTDNEQRADEYFEKLKSNYSTLLAKRVMKYCSEDLILKNLKRGVVLSYRDLLSILPKRKEFVLKYLRQVYEMLKTKQKYSHLIKTNSFDRVFKILLLLNPEEAMQIVNDYRGFVNSFPALGTKITKHILQLETCRGIIIENSNYFSKYLKFYPLFKYFSEDEYKVYYRGLFPQKKNDFRTDKHGKIYEGLNYYGENREKKLKLLLDTYSSVYNEDLLSSIKNLTPEIMKLLPPEKRNKFTEELLSCSNQKDKNMNFNQEELICYSTWNIAFPKLRAKICHTWDAKERGKYLRYMVKCCVINDDMKAFLDLLNYFVQNHRNEITDVQFPFIKEFLDDMTFKKFNSDHWKTIHEILNLLIVYNEIGRFYILERLIVPYIEYQLENKLPIDDSCRIFITYFAESYSWYTLNDILEKLNRGFRKILLIKFLELIPKVKIPSTYDAFYVIKAIQSWNRVNQNNVISLCDYKWLRNVIDETIKDKNDDHILKLHEFFKYDKKSSELYLSKIKSLEVGTVEDVNWYMKENSDAIFNHLDNFCKKALYTFPLRRYTLPLIKSGKIRRYPRLLEELKKFCIDIMQTSAKSDIHNKKDNEEIMKSHSSDEENSNFEDETNVKGATDEEVNKNDFKDAAVRVLAYLLEPQEFFELVREYLPQKSRIDVSDKNARHLYEVQTSIAVSLKLLKDYPETFDVLRKFCCGDYLKLTVGSLNSICVKTPFYKAKQFLDSCLDTPVSFKKHVIRLQLQISNQEYVTDFLKKLLEQEQNPSIREILLTRVFNQFTMESNLEWWQLLRSTIETQTFISENVLTMLTNYQDVSFEFLPEYYEFMWNTLNRLESPSVVHKFDLFKKNSLVFLTENFNLIDDSVSFKILNENLFEADFLKLEEYMKRCYFELAVRFAFHKSLSTTKNLATVNEDECLQLIIAKIQKFSELHCVATRRKTNYEEFLNARKLIAELLDSFGTISIAERQKYKNSLSILMKLEEKLNEIFPDPSILYHRVMTRLQFCKAFLQCNSLKDFGRNVRNLIDNEIAVYGTYTITNLARIIESIMKLIRGYEADSDKNMSEIIEGLLDSPLQSIECVLVVINIINLEDLLKKKVYENILKCLQVIDDKRVQIYLNGGD